MHWLLKLLSSLLVCNPTSVSASIFELAYPQNTTKSRSNDGSISTRGASVGNIVFERLMKKKCKNKQKLFLKKGVTQAECEAECANNAECTAVEYKSSADITKAKCILYKRCDGDHRGGACPSKLGKKCALKKRIEMLGTPKYVVRGCVVDAIGDVCTPKKIPDLRYTDSPTANSCEENMGQRGSVTYVDLILPTNKVFFVEVVTNVPGQTSEQGFFVRPTHLTRNWGKAVVTNKKASFYLADTGQFSVEFTPDSTWRNYNKVKKFDALMLFVNPPLPIPKNLELILPPSLSSSPGKKYTDLGPNKKYLFVAGVDYDWGRDHVFKVHDDTSIYFEKGSYVRARIVQTEKKVKNVEIHGYGTLDVHYDLEFDLVGISDDATRQNIGIYGKNIRVSGLTFLNTNPTCGLFGYCLNINANWSPIVDKSNPFDAFDLQQDPPYKFQQAHCQQNNMDDSPNTDFTNCPTSHANGQKVSHVKCMTWSLGHDGLNAGNYGTVEKSFVRANDDSIKPWDSNGIYRDITIWQLMLGWPINFGWWNWNQPDEDTLVENIYVIHNQNWASSGDWPETSSGQCVIGGIYGSGAVKKRYHINNVYVETATSCAVGLEISKKAYSRHPTVDGCVGSMIDMQIENLHFDEEFYQTYGGGGYNNYLSGEKNPNSACTGDLKGEVKNMEISGLVAGRSLAKSDFIVKESSVVDLTFKEANDPYESKRSDYIHYTDRNAYAGNGGTEIDTSGVAVLSSAQCIDRCDADWSCECVVFSKSDSKCWKRGQCDLSKFDSDVNYDVYMRQWN